jgi:hypothetical protein
MLKLIFNKTTPILALYTTMSLVIISCCKLNSAVLCTGLHEADLAFPDGLLISLTLGSRLL